MSDARPITNVTEFVCGACWNSFSRADEGVMHGDYVICPHCSHRQPLHDGDGGAWVDLVRNAPGSADSNDSAQFGFGAGEGASGFVASEDTVPGEEGGGGGVRAPGAAAPPAGHRATVRDDVSAGVIAGDPAEMAGAFSGSNSVSATASVSRLQVLSQPGSRPSRSDFAADTMQEGEHDFGEALDQDRDTLSQEIPSAAGEDFEEASGITGESTDLEAAELADGAEPGAAGLEEEVEPKDWKVKAPPGLTYNFHSMDAMLGWAANKSGLDMKVSIGGEEWHDFEPFLEAIRAGLSPMRALRLAAGGGEVSARIAAIKEAPQLSAFDEIQQVDAHEEVRQRFSGNRAEEAEAEWEAAEVNDDTVDDEEPEELEELEEAVEASEPAASAGHRLRPPVSTSPSRRLPAVSGQTRRATGLVQKTPLSPRGKGKSASLLIAILLGVLVAAAAAVHFTAIYRIPGLPF